MRMLFKGGPIVSGDGVRLMDLLVDGQIISQVGENLSCADANVVDVCNTTTADDFATGIRAAIRGGTTVIIDFACPNDDWNENIRAEIPNMLEAGIPSFKMYMTYPAIRCI